MPQETQRRDPIIAAMEAKIAAWQKALASYREAISLDAPLGDVSAPARTESPSAMPNALPVGVFRGMGLKEAIPIYLEAGRRKQANKEIAQGLLKGGLATTAKNLEASVAVALSRLRDEGVVLRFDDGWDLAASYPESLRNRLNGKAAAAKLKPVLEIITDDADPTLVDKTALILKFIDESAGRPLQYRDILERLKAQGIVATPDYVRVVVKRLAARGAINFDHGRISAVSKPTSVP